MTESDFEKVAKVAHEANRAYCEILGDYSQPRWEDAPEWQRKSIVAGVKAHYADAAMTPRMIHQVWMDRKLEEGWKWGPKKDPDKKEHPCIVPYDQLSTSQQVKDALFLAVSRALFLFPSQE